MTSNAMREKNMFLILLYCNDEEENIKNELQNIHNCLMNK